MAISIPDGLKDDHFTRIEKLLKGFLKELARTGAKRVTSRLNRSDTQQASPVWVGTWESQQIMDGRVRRREPTYLGGARYKHENRSPVYAEALNDNAGDVIWKNWRNPQSRGENPQVQYGPGARCMFQAFVAIRIPEGSQHRHVGTLTAGFMENPNRDQVERIMKKWAQKNSSYVRYLKKQFRLGGPLKR